MTDREMLELAALAAGYEGSYVFRAGGQKGSGLPYHISGFQLIGGAMWNPRDNDGDSRRLEVKLEIKVAPYPIYSEEKHSVIASRKRWAPPEDDNTYVGPECIELYGDDPCAATRLAVLRVAAEIGRQMKEQSK